MLDAASQPKKSTPILHAIVLKVRCQVSIAGGIFGTSQSFRRFYSGVRISRFLVAWRPCMIIVSTVTKRERAMQISDTFKGNFTQQEPIPEDAIAAAIEVMRSGRLHRYNVAEGEISETAWLEQEFASYIGAKYCLAVASGGYALTAALKAAQCQANEPVLTNGFTLSPVPGAITAAGGRVVLVDITANLVIDLADLERKIKDSGATKLMLSHMRGHLVDMNHLMDICNRHSVLVIEDCAHTMGASWAGKKSGLFGQVACYSTQTYKHINSGEGGFIVTDDESIAARATVLSGSYMLYGRHLSAPSEQHFDQIRLETPNCSGRMDNLRAAILRPQLRQLDDSVARWNKRYQAIEKELTGVPGLSLSVRPEQEYYVGSSIQFLAEEFDEGLVRSFLARCLERGVELKWFGATDPVAYTSRHQSWHYVEPQQLPESDRLLSILFDMRIPLTFSVADCQQIGSIIRECFNEIRSTMLSPAIDSVSQSV